MPPNRLSSMFSLSTDVWGSTIKAYYPRHAPEWARHPTNAYLIAPRADQTFFPPIIFTSSTLASILYRYRYLCRDELISLATTRLANPISSVDELEAVEARYATKPTFPQGLCYFKDRQKPGTCIMQIRDSEQRKPRFEDRVLTS